MNKQNQYDARVWEIATIIKIVATHDTNKICRIANRIKSIYGENVDEIDNNIVYNAYTGGAEL